MHGIGEVKDFGPRHAGQVIADILEPFVARKAKCACRRAETCAVAALRIAGLRSLMVEAALPKQMDFLSPTKRMAP